MPYTGAPIWLTNPEPTPEELSEFKSSLTLGFAGFLIVAGIVSLVLGGSLWEPKGFNEDGSPPNDATPAFGFTPKPPAPNSGTWKTSAHTHRSWSCRRARSTRARTRVNSS